MLNEFLEYDQYMGQIRSRINPSLVSTKNGAGIPRALWIIARHELGERNYWDDRKLIESNRGKDTDLAYIRRNIRNEVMEKMKEWYADGSKLEEFYIDYCCKGAGDQSLEKWQAFIDPKRKMWEKKWEIESQTDGESQTESEIKTIFSLLSPNLENATNLTRILCEAICAGPLQNRYVVCNKSFVDALSSKFRYARDKKKPDDSIPIRNSKGEYTEYIMPLMKIISAWLIKEKYCLSIRRTDLGNWMDNAAFGNSSERWAIVFKPEKEKPINLFDLLFPEIGTRAGKYTEDKYRADKRITDYFKTEYGLRLINKNDIKENAYVISEDTEKTDKAFTPVYFVIPAEAN